MSFVSKYSLGAYLLSYVADRLVYKYYGIYFGSFDIKLRYIIVPIIAVLIISLVGSVLVTEVSNILYRNVVKRINSLNTIANEN